MWFMLCRCSSREDHLRVHEHENRVAILFHHSASRRSLLLTFGVVWLVLGWRFLLSCDRNCREQCGNGEKIKKSYSEGFRSGCI